MHNEEQVRYACKCDETHLRGFLLIAQKLVIACICIARNKLDLCSVKKTAQVRYVMQCDETQEVVFLRLVRLVNACICITRNKLD